MTATKKKSKKKSKVKKSNARSFVSIKGQLRQLPFSRAWASEAGLTPGRLGILRGKKFEALVLDDLRTWFRGRCHIMTSKDFAEHMLPQADKKKLIIVKHFFSKYRTDIMIINPKNKKRLVIECRYYSGPGSMEERFGNFFFKAQESGIDTIVIRGGDGWSKRCIDLSVKYMKLFKRIKEMFHRDEEKTLIKKYIKAYLKIK